MGKHKPSVHSRMHAGERQVPSLFMETQSQWHTKHNNSQQESTSEAWP